MNAVTGVFSAAEEIRAPTPSPYTTGTAPRSRSHAWWRSLASAITRAPVRTASWTANTPTPPPAPAITTASPAVGATARTVATPVAPATNSAPATSHGTPAGFAVRLAASTTTYWAWLARLSV